MAGDLIPLEGSTLGKIKSFWSRKEGKVGMVFLTLIAGVVLYKVLPYMNQIAAYLVSLTHNGILLILNLVALFFLLMIFTSRRVWFTLSMGFELLMYHLTDKVFVTLDPVGMAKVTLKKLQGMIDNLLEKKEMIAGKGQMAQDKIERLGTQLEECQRRKRALIEAATEAKRKAKAAGQQVDLSRYTGEIAVEDNQFRRLDTYLKQLIPIRQLMTDLYERLTKIANYTQSRQRDLENFANMEIEKRSFMKDMKAAIRSARAILQGGEVKGLYDAAIDQMQRDFDRDLGEVRNFMREISPLLDRIDLDNEMAIASANKAIDEALGKMDQFLDQKGQPLLPEARQDLLFPATDAVFEEIPSQTQAGVKKKKHGYGDVIDGKF